MLGEESEAQKRENMKQYEEKKVQTSFKNEEWKDGKILFECIIKMKQNTGQEHIKNIRTILENKAFDKKKKRK